MFKFLKDKLKNAVSKFTKDVEEEVEEKVEPVKEEVAEKKPQKTEQKKPVKEKASTIPKKSTEKEITQTIHKETEQKKQEQEEKKEPEKKQTLQEEKEEEKKPEKKSFFSKVTEVVTKKTLSEEKFEDLFFELEIALMENNVAVEVIEKIKDDLKQNLLSQKVSRTNTEKLISDTLKSSIEDLFDVDTLNLLKEIDKKKPFVICFIGVNGSGKTTNLAKIANMLKSQGKKVVIAACDTFRAAAIAQIEDHAKRLDIRLIKHDYGADAAAVAFDAIEHAKARGLDVVLIDTAGRSHSNTNLMDELKKVVKVSNPDLKIFVGDSLTGNDVVEQAKSFNEKVGIDAIILTKADVDEKGGGAISVSYVTGKPIIYIGTGQEYKDIKPFSKHDVMKNLDL